MRLVKKAEARKTKSIASQTELVGTLSDLVHSMNSVPKNNAIVTAEIRDSAIWALAVAKATERRIAEHMERITYLEQLAVTDDMTGLLNRRGFEAELKKAVAQAERYKEGGVLIYVDLDDFKPINDTFGHAAGDEVLKRVAGILKETTRPTDAVGRLGGDEFGILLVRTTWDDGGKRAETIDKVLNKTNIPWNAGMIALSASLGIQGYGAKDCRHDLLKQADDAMYRTKRLRAEMQGQQLVRG